MTEIYLDEYTCKQSGISYWEGHTEDVLSGEQEVALNVGSLMHWRRAWDSTHRRLFAEYVSSGEALLVRAALGPGWFEVTNYPPNKIKMRTLSVEEILRTD